jgi:hypothetical protein
MPFYDTNENRKFYTRNGIHTSFVCKGKPTKDEKERKLLFAVPKNQKTLSIYLGSPSGECFSYSK